MYPKIEDGDTVGVFPQGTRHPGKNPRETEVKHGVGLISYRAKCGVIPVFVKTKKRQVKYYPDEYKYKIGKSIFFARVRYKIFSILPVLPFPS